MNLQLADLARRYVVDDAEPERVIREAHARVSSTPAGIWIERRSLDAVLADLDKARAARAGGAKLPLFGVPFAVKDNIDVAGVPTTAACPAFRYVPETSAPVVELLVRAGAIVMGKTNLDQFATGLVGTRSPYGACPNAFDARYISGGSSSGSAVAVANGSVSFSLGTDTAGSGRVPAALNNVVGLKPTRGYLSTRGVVPACRSLDCVSIFAGSTADARAVLGVCAGFDANDPLSRPPPHYGASLPRRPRLGIPSASELEFFGDADAERLFFDAVRELESLGGARVEIDYRPFRRGAELLYSDAFVAERLVATGALLEKDPSAIVPVVRGILEGALRFTALDVFEAEQRLAGFRQAARREWEKMDVLVLPTTPTTYLAGEVEADPIGKNARLGRYTNFVNLFDLAAVAVPAGFRGDGQPLGVSFVGPAWTDHALLDLAERFHARRPAKVGATKTDVSATNDENASDDRVLLAVVGAHLAGEPLNHQLTSRGAELVRACRTSPEYRLFALKGTVPPKPGLVFDAEYRGSGIEVEVWALDVAAFGSFVDEVPAPLAIGALVLEDGSTVNGFVCEPHATTGAVEISRFGGWRAYRASLASPGS